MWVADPWKSGKTWADAMIILIRGDAEQWSETKKYYQSWDLWSLNIQIMDLSITWAPWPWTYQPRDSRTSLLALLSWMVLSTIGGTTGKSCRWSRGKKASLKQTAGQISWKSLEIHWRKTGWHFPLKFLDWNQPNDWSSLADTGRLKFESPLQMKHLHQSSLTATASTTGSN